MKQVVEFGFRVYGAGGDDIFEGHDLALEAWGERANDKNSALLAFAYLWRRFGPPWRGGDDHKSLVDYTLTTDDPHVFLWLHLNGCGLAYSVGYLAHASIREERTQLCRVDKGKWRDDTGVVNRVNRAVFDALKELERPVYVRDCPLNVFGRCDESDDSAEPSKYAGLGIPQEAMDRLLDDEDDGETEPAKAD